MSAIEIAAILHKNIIHIKHGPQIVKFLECSGSFIVDTSAIRAEITGLLCLRISNSNIEHTGDRWLVLCLDIFSDYSAKV